VVTIDKRRRKSVEVGRRSRPKDQNGTGSRK
jgi:hypothetical protein